MSLSSPSLLLLVRDATETGSNGCVVCSSVPDCPVCDSGERCVQSTQTCEECPTTYCQAVVSTSGSSSSSSNVGGIAGGVIGGVALLVISAYLFYRFYFKKKLAFKQVHKSDGFYDFDNEDYEINFHHNLPTDGSGTGTGIVTGTGTDLEKPSSRSSFATMFTRASNIIPIAYIPGVTIGTNATTTQNKSNIRVSTVSDAGTFDSSLIGDRFSNASIVQNPSLTTTAIRAKPKLITVSNIAPHNNDASGGGDGDPAHDGIPRTAVGVKQLGGVKSVKVGKRKNFGLQEDLIEEEEEEEYEYGDEEENEEKTKTIPILGGNRYSQDNDEYDPFIIDDGDESKSDSESLNSKAESNGSVILEVEIDRPRLDPFDDSSKTAP